MLEGALLYLQELAKSENATLLALVRVRTPIHAAAQGWSVARASHLYHKQHSRYHRYDQTAAQSLGQRRQCRPYEGHAPTPQHDPKQQPGTVRRPTTRTTRGLDPPYCAYTDLAGLRCRWWAPPQPCACRGGRERGMVRHVGCMAQWWPNPLFDRLTVRDGAKGAVGRPPRVLG